MAAGDTTQGRRLKVKSPMDLEQVGDYTVTSDSEGRCVWGAVPDGTFAKHDDGGVSGCIRLPLEGPNAWGFEEHEDGSITLSPSIFVNPPTGWHGFLERGVWREV